MSRHKKSAKIFKSIDVKSDSQEDLKELKNLLKENIALTKELEERMQKVNRWIMWQKTFAWLKFILIAVPIVLGILYLPPLLQDIFMKYQDFWIW